ncbi:phosphatase PAP2 family protein [Chryseosolibacter indicus]|uniref:Phosphatase PAP2 family protein n=1 Tax=Chryseosolibacter indicus TaxID=2782351 RepID=A0ABS5VSZ1_9BACT|nr:phosphatase PAP2 family protein [Chryseosolibacter indicus]MBT1704544.1 phosphatase PAP2 family protein [Chryseosolibacter indicus]
MEHLIELDKKFFLLLNSLHSEELDQVMMYISQTIIWVPLYLLLLFLILRKYRNDSWLPLLGILITIVIADQFASGVLKPITQRLRPSREPSLEGLVHIVNGYKGGKYGFASSHAANTFGLATFIWLIFRENLKWCLLLFIWAAVVSYSRIYLGVHYPGDIVAGILIGVLAAFAGFKFTQWLGNITKRKNSVT